jgi:hypothetical protein
MLAKKTKADLTDKQLLRYNRHIVLPEIDIDGQKLLLNSKVVANTTLNTILSNYSGLIVDVKNGVDK